MQLEYILAAHGFGGKTGDMIPPIPPVENFKGNSNNVGTQINLSWSVSSLNEYEKVQIFMADTNISNLDYKTLSTGNYDMIVNANKTSHSVTGLKHNTTKYFKAFQIFNTFGEVRESKGVALQVTTKDTVAPGEVKGVNIRGGDKAIIMNWTNPSDNDLLATVIRINTVAISNINDGEQMYSGTGQSVNWKVKDKNKKHYIRVFTKDINGNINSGTSMQYTTETDSQQAPSKPSVSNIEFDRATVSGGSNTEVKMGSGSWFTSPRTFTGLSEKTSYIAYSRYKETDIQYASSQSSGSTFTTPAKTTIPGPSKLQAGTMQEGFYGFVSASDIINGFELARMCGITEGTLQNNDIRWLKFAWKGKILFRPQKTIRHSISWNHIDSKGCVYGKNISFGGNTYKVRLMRGALTDPSKVDDNDKGAHGSEYNRLILPLHEQARTSSWDYKDYVESNLPDWGIGLTNDDFGATYGTSGPRAWSMEKTSENGNHAVYRGNFSGSSFSDSSTTDEMLSRCGWAPILEVVL